MQIKQKGARLRSYWFVVAAFLLISLIVGILCYQYYKTLQYTVKNESGEYLQEISKQIAGNASRTINANFAVLGTIANYLKNSGIHSYAELQPEVRAQQSFWNYKDILLIDARGNAYDAKGTVVLLGGEEYLRDAVVNRRRAMSSSQFINSVECMVFAIPISGLIINNTEIFALAATYDLATFDSILSMTSFGGRAYAHIVQRDGAIVVRSSSKHAPLTGYNILSSLVTAVMDDGANLGQLKKHISEGISGVMSYTQNNQAMYMAYTPLETKEWVLLSFVPVEVVNAKSQLLTRITLLLCAAITLIFSMLVAFQMHSYSQHKQKLEHIAYVDPLTGGHTPERFYELAEALLAGTVSTRYALVYINVERFKLLNEEYGRKACDDMLCILHKSITSDLSAQECMCRLYADNFCALITHIDLADLNIRFRSWYEKTEHLCLDKGNDWLSPVVEFGVYIINNEALPFPHMIDRAKLALRETSPELRWKIRHAVYDDSARHQLYREKHMEKIMVQALTEREFQVWMQPKFRTDTNALEGAEALVRWSGSEGLLQPDDFIPLFEKNNFILELDHFVLKEVCRSIHSWINTGLTPQKVSVNCSRIHLHNPQFLEGYLEICRQFDVPPAFIEIELAEHLIFDDTTTLRNIIRDIRAAGFSCAIDNFSNGYASLNFIQDTPVDTIKLGKTFFRRDVKDISRTESIVGNIISMANSLNLNTVAEGVEEQSHVNMLKRLGCSYIQGFIYAKPVPFNDFERLAFGHPAADACKIFREKNNS